MNILIIEDEPPIARNIERIVRDILHNKNINIFKYYNIDEAKEFLTKNKIDLCLLDLNLSGKDGFDILRETITHNFHTIVISAYEERAIEAFSLGVLDFISKPIKIERLKRAIERVLGNDSHVQVHTKYLGYKKRDKIFLLSVKDICYFHSSGYLIEAHIENDEFELLDKSLNHLEKILPRNFLRIHRSVIVNIDYIDWYKHDKGGVYKIGLKNKVILPLSRIHYKKLNRIFHRHD